MLQLMQQATEAREAREAMTEPHTPHERAVDTFQAFLKTQLLKIPENVWVNYTIAAMAMAHNFSQTSQQQMGHMELMPLMGPPQQMPLMGPPQQQAHQPQSLMGPSQTPPPVMSCSPMATSPMDWSPTQFHRTVAARLTAAVLTETAATADINTITAGGHYFHIHCLMQPARSSSCSALPAAFTAYPSLDTPRPAPVTPEDSSLIFPGLMDADHTSV